MAGPLGRRTPPNFDHVQAYRFKSVAPKTVSDVNRVLRLPIWHWTHDQGLEGSCVGHACAMERAISNTAQNILLNTLGLKTRRYSSLTIWNEAKKIDSWDDTNPGDDNGTSVHAAYDVLRAGAARIKKADVVNGRPYEYEIGPVDPAEGIAANRWATNVDEMRTAIAGGSPVVIGVNWYENFDRPEGEGKEIWIGKGELGRARGGHAVCLYGASDRRQAFRVKNSWGKTYPLVWLPYATMGRLLREYGEAALVTDR